MKTLIYVLTYIFFLGHLTAAHAAVSIEESLSDSDYPITCMNFRVNITDQLNTYDIKKLQNAFDNINKKSQDAPCLNRKLVVWLDSTGGEVLAAIELGRILRKNEVHVAVKKECSSACVFVFAGGVR
jgi:ClpP class serine protease